MGILYDRKVRIQVRQLARFRRPPKFLELTLVSQFLVDKDEVQSLRLYFFIND